MIAAVDLPAEEEDHETSLLKARNSKLLNNGADGSDVKSSQANNTLKKVLLSPKSVGPDFLDTKLSNSGVN